MDELDIDSVAALFAQQIKDLQAMCWPRQRMQDILHLLGVKAHLHTQNLAIPQQNIIALTADNYGQDNDVVRHELNHLALHWSGLDKWLDAYADDPDRMNEWLCHNMTLFWAIPQPYVDAAHSEQGEHVLAVIELSRTAECGLDLALRRFVHDSPHLHRAGFRLQHGRVAQVEVNGFRLPFWLHDAVEEDVERLFGDEVKLSVFRPQRGHVIGLVTL